MRPIFFALTLAITALPSLAQITGPQEVGTTTMPSGQYFITEQLSHKSYNLTVTDKGNMILAPAAGSETPATSVVPAVPAAGAAAATPATPASPFAGIAPAAPAQAAAAATTAPKSLSKTLVQQGVEKGMSELTKLGGTGALGSGLSKLGGAAKVESELSKLGGNSSLGNLLK